MERAARLGQEDGPVTALEERHTERLFQLADLTADGAVGQVEFVGRAHKAAKPCGGLEEPDRAQPVHRRQIAHLSGFLTVFGEYISVVWPYPVWRE
ncbi:hypothetical protein D3C85_1194000 [compost metagenome]